MVKGYTERVLIQTMRYRLRFVKEWKFFIVLLLSLFKAENSIWGERNDFFIGVILIVFLFDFTRLRKQNDWIIEQNEKVISLLEEINSVNL